MRSPSRVFLFAVALSLLTSLPAVGQRAPKGVKPGTDSTLAILFAGCYQLTVSPDLRPYQLRLGLRHVGARWEAQTYGPGAHNGAGDSWSWTPVDTNAFGISWGGIDTAMEFDITRHGSALQASGTLF